MQGRLPESFVDQVLAKADIIDVLSKWVKLKKAGHQYTGLCPFHQEKTPSFSVNPHKQFYYCFGCGVHGDAIQFLMDHQHMPFVEAVETLANSLGLKIPVTEQPAKSRHEPDLYGLLGRAAKFYQQTLKDSPRAIEYLKGRGLTGATAKRYGLGYAPAGWRNLLAGLGGQPIDTNQLEKSGLMISKPGNSSGYDRFRDRIMFPIRDKRGRVVGFGGRVLDKSQQPKYLNSPETLVFKKNQELYGLYEARQASRELSRLLVVEGYMDVVSLAEHGFTQAVATLGTAPSITHIQQIFKICPEIVFCFDADNAGDKAAERALHLSLPEMLPGRMIRFLRLPPGLDPDSYIRANGLEAFQRQISQAKTLADFLFDKHLREVDLAHIEGRSLLVAKIKPDIGLLPVGIYREMVINRLAQLVGLDKNLILGQPQSENRDYQWRKVDKAAPLPPISPAERAIALLLQNRELVSVVPEQLDFLRRNDVAGSALLAVMIDILQVDPHINLDDLIARVPPQHASHVMTHELRAIVELVPKTGVEEEFKGALAKLKARAQEQILESLLLKAKTGNISNSEKEQLKLLLQNQEMVKSAG